MCSPDSRHWVQKESSQPYAYCSSNTYLLQSNFKTDCQTLTLMFSTNIKNKDELFKSLSFREKTISLGSSFFSNFFSHHFLCYERIMVQKTEPLWDGDQSCLLLSTRNAFFQLTSIAPFWRQLGPHHWQQLGSIFWVLLLICFSHPELTFLKWFRCLNCGDIFLDMNSEHIAVESILSLRILIIVSPTHSENKKLYIYFCIFSKCRLHISIYS